MTIKVTINDEYKYNNWFYKFDDNNDKFVNMRNFILELKKIQDYKIKTVKDIDWIENISQEQYGDISMYWIIAFYNNIIDPITLSNDYVGQNLKIPNRNQVNNLLLKYKLVE